MAGRTQSIIRHRIYETRYLVNWTRPTEFVYETMMIHATVLHVGHQIEAKKLLYVGSSCIYLRQCPKSVKGRMLAQPPTRNNERVIRLSQDA